MELPFSEFEYDKLVYRPVFQHNLTVTSLCISTFAFSADYAHSLYNKIKQTEGVNMVENCI
jgi:hypothetical protein